MPPRQHMDRMLSNLRPARLLPGALAVLAIITLGAILATARSSGKDEPAGTVAVARGTVVSTVSADGNVEPPQELSLGFETTGRLVEVPVKEGDHVRQGDVLARVQDGPQRAALDSAQANLGAARSRLAQTRTGLTPVELALRQRMATQSRAAVRNAERDLANARRVGGANVSGLRRALSRARVSGEEADLRASELRLAQERTRVGALQQAYQRSRGQSDADHDDLRDALDRLRDAQNDTPPDQAQINDANFKIAVSQDRVSRDEADESRAKADLDTATSTARTYVQDVAGDRVSLREARRRLGDASDSLANGVATTQQQLDSAKSSLRTSEAQLGVTLATNRVDEQVKGADVASALSTVAQARASLEDAAKALDDTRLRAPVAGVVGHVDAKVGELVGTAGRSALAGAPSAQGAQGTSTEPSSAARPESTSPSAGALGSQGVITLAQVHGLQVKADFNETDAAELHVGDRATVSVDALPDQRFAAHVASIDPIERVINNVVTYEVTLVLDRDQGRLKPGMTATADVTVARVDDALTVPRTAVRSPEGANPTVTVVRPDGKQEARLVVTGLQSDSKVQIVGGVGLGEHVVRTIAAPPDLTG